MIAVSTASDCVFHELLIIQEELRVVGVKVGIMVIEGWDIKTRAKVEQWAIRKRWSNLLRPPCPKGHSKKLGAMPKAISKFEVKIDIHKKRRG